MKSNFFSRSLAVLLVIALVAPTTFFTAPRRASASAASCIGGLLGTAGSAAMGVAREVVGMAAVPVSNMSIESSSASTAGTTMGSCVYDVIIVPAARAAIRALLAQITASTINWITGRNSSGKASFVRNISVNLQGVGDAAAVPFFNQVATGFNSPFGPAISSALQLQYAQQTSMAGFFAANRNTLAQYSPNPNAFIRGSWSQGGMKAWFALTGPNPNNPYILYQAAQNQLGNTVTQAQTNRRQDMVQSSGFLSWCGGDTTSTSGTCVANANGSCPAGCVPDDDVASGCSGTSVSPQPQCVNRDGTPAAAVTPGSAIHGYTQKAVVGLGIDQLISANELDAAFGAVVGALMSQVIGGVTGLFGASQPSSSGSGRPSIVTQLNNTSGVSANSTVASADSAESMLANISLFIGSWNRINTAALTASTTLDSLTSFCTAAATDAEQHPNEEQGKTSSFASAARAQASAAQTAISVSIAPVLTQARTATSSVEATKELALRLQAEAAGGASPDTLSSQVGTLLAMPPTGADVSTAQSMATVTNTAVSLPRPVYPDTTPTISLSVSGGSIVDQMNLLSTNAEALKQSVCVPVPTNTTTGGGGSD